MTLTIELEPEVEKQIEEIASRAGVSKEEWARDFLKNNLREAAIKQPLSQAQQSEIQRKLQLMKESVEAAHEYSKGKLPLSDYAVSREGMYDYEVERNL